MAVKLSSDLILDVMRNADPARRNAAVARLQSLQLTDQTSFATALDGLKIQVPGNVGDSGSQGNLATRSLHLAPQFPGSQESGAYQGFERLVLRNLFETLLPDEKSGAFGGGPSAGVWRSMAADQLAGVYSSSGGIGLATMLEGSKTKEAPEREAQWPYFSVDSIKTFTG